jgi:integration host factor subunit beta
MRGKLRLRYLLLIAAIGILPPLLAKADSSAEGGKLADPQPLDQVGFPVQLYEWTVPRDNPQTTQKIALGRALFFDPRLSADDKESCATCHTPEKGFTDQLPTSMGIHNQFGQRNAPTIVNAMFDAMANSLARGERIEIRGFGSFAVKHRRARQGRNPKTGAIVKVDAKRIPFFRAGKELRIEVNGAGNPQR